MHASDARDAERKIHSGGKRGEFLALLCTFACVESGWGPVRRHNGVRVNAPRLAVIVGVGAIELSARRPE